jgi:hypothetical protein
MSDREAFEKWAKDKCHLDSFEFNGVKLYAAHTAKIMWQAWQAAQAQAVNQKLLEALQGLVAWADGPRLDALADLNKARAAIAAAQEQGK